VQQVSTFEIRRGHFVSPRATSRLFEMLNLSSIIGRFHADFRSEQQKTEYFGSFLSFLVSDETYPF
jgi:uncharacterized protein YhdP